MSTPKFSTVMKAKLKKVSKLKLGGADNERAIESLYDKVNEIIDSVSKQDDATRSQARGKTGNIRIVKKGDGKYYLEAKTDKGWGNIPLELNLD